MLAQQPLCRLDPHTCAGALIRSPGLERLSLRFRLPEPCFSAATYLHKLQKDRT